MLSGSKVTRVERGERPLAQLHRSFDRKIATDRKGSTAIIGGRSLAVQLGGDVGIGQSGVSNPLKTNVGIARRRPGDASHTRFRVWRYALNPSSISSTCGPLLACGHCGCSASNGLSRQRAMTSTKRSFSDKTARPDSCGIRNGSG